MSARYFRLLAVSIPALLFLAGCGSDDEAQKRVVRLQSALQPGVPLAQAEALLKSEGGTYSLRTAQECEALVEASRVPTQLKPKGGPCLFGKVPVSRHWYGARNDVILQLVFDRDSILRDGSFEAIEGM